MPARSFPVPATARTALLGSAATVDQLDLAATLGNPWARKVVAKENARLLTPILGDDTRLPYGVTAADDDDLIVTGLTRDGQVWTPDGWADTDDMLDMIPLDVDEVAFVARGLIEGHTHFVLRGYTPVAMIGAGGDTSTDIPAGARLLAIVDDLDRNAVLDLVAILPGPKVLRRHDGTWQEDPNWMRVLRSVKPPPVVELDEGQVASVLPQIDEATKGKPFTKEPPKKATGIAAAAYSMRADDMAIEFALLAAPPGKALSQATPGGRSPLALRRYWTTGAGGARIRWGSPGAWTRCHRNLSKYVGPFRARGLCTNLGKVMGGYGVAHHVG
jgi:hypothetical protein